MHSIASPIGEQIVRLMNPKHFPIFLKINSRQDDIAEQHFPSQLKMNSQNVTTQLEMALQQRFK